MDLLAALGLVFMIEGLALAVFARSLPQIAAEIGRLGPGFLRLTGLVCIALGVALYLAVRAG